MTDLSSYEASEMGVYEREDENKHICASTGNMKTGQIRTFMGDIDESVKNQDGLPNDAMLSKWNDSPSPEPFTIIHDVNTDNTHLHGLLDSVDFFVSVNMVNKNRGKPARVKGFYYDDVNKMVVPVISEIDIPTHSEFGSTGKTHFWYLIENESGTYTTSHHIFDIESILSKLSIEFEYNVGRSNGYKKSDTPTPAYDMGYTHRWKYETIKDTCEALEVCVGIGEIPEDEHAYVTDAIGPGWMTSHNEEKDNKYRVKGGWYAFTDIQKCNQPGSDTMGQGNYTSLFSADVLFDQECASEEWTLRNIEFKNTLSDHDSKMNGVCHFIHDQKDGDVEDEWIQDAGEEGGEETITETEEDGEETEEGVEDEDEVAEEGEAIQQNVYELNSDLRSELGIS